MLFLSIALHRRASLRSRRVAPPYILLLFYYFILQLLKERHGFGGSLGARLGLLTRRASIYTIVFFYSSLLVVFFLLCKLPLLAGVYVVNGP